MIKKVLLSVFVIATFVIYSLHQRAGASNVAPVVANTPNSASSSATTTTPATSTSNTTTAGQYKDGSYTGSSADAFYGYIKVKVVISGGKITDVVFLDHPSDRQTSIEINDQAMPLLKQQTIAVQSANVDGVSGATDTSMAFIQSLSNALSQAKA